MSTDDRDVTPSKRKKAKKEKAIASAPQPSPAPPVTSTVQRILDKALKVFALVKKKPRDIQVEALRRCITSYENGAEYVILEAPPGVGKSLVAVGLAYTYGNRAYFTTLTAQLQEQYISELSGPLGMRALKGRGKYHCQRADESCFVGKELFVGEGSCYGPPDKTSLDPQLPTGDSGACPYLFAKQAAFNSPLMMANYHSFLANIGQAGAYNGNSDEEEGIEVAEKGDSAEDGSKPDVRRPFMVLDECFPKGTLVSGRQIETLKVGDYVPSFDDESGQVSSCRVSALMNSRPRSMVKVHLTNGQVIACTSSHPFWTCDGWNPAIELAGRSVLLTRVNESYSGEETGEKVQMSPLQKSVHAQWVAQLLQVKTTQSGVQHLLQPEMFEGWKENQGNVAVRNMRSRDNRDRTTSRQPPTAPKDLLFPKMHNAGKGKVGPEARDEVFKAKFQTHEEEQPNVGPYGQGQGNDQSQGNGQVVPSSERRERQRTDGTRTVNVDGIGVVDRGDSTDPDQTDGRLPDALQAGRGERGIESGHRGRRSLPLQSQGAGPKEGSLLTWVGVDRVEVLEQTSDGTFGGVCPDGLVYNLEVEGPHTYFAEGAVVHNCHSLEGFLLEQTGVTVNLRKLGIRSNPLPTTENELGPYAEWMKQALPLLRTREKVLTDVQEKEEMRSLIRKVGLVVSKIASGNTDYVIERIHDEKNDGVLKPDWFAIKPLRVHEYGHWLWGYGKRQLLMSATVLDAGQLATNIGLDLSKGDFVQMGSVFPVANRPIIVTPLDMRRPNRDFSWPRAAQMVNNLMTHHSREKGLLLCPSNEMLKFIADNVSKLNRMRLIFAYGQDREAKYQEHCLSSSPTVLAASGYWEGADLKGDWSRFQLIPAAPRPIWQGQIKARAKVDPAWYRWLTWTKLIQGLGRSVRAESDECVTYLMDQEFVTEMNRKSGSMIPPWVREAVRVVGGTTAENSG